MQYNKYNGVAIWSLKQHVSNCVVHHQVFFYDVMRFVFFCVRYLQWALCVCVCVCVCMCMCSGLCSLFRGF